MHSSQPRKIQSKAISAFNLRALIIASQEQKDKILLIKRDYWWYDFKYGWVSTKDSSANPVGKCT